MQLATVAQSGVLKPLNSGFSNPLNIQNLKADIVKALGLNAAPVPVASPAAVRDVTVPVAAVTQSLSLPQFDFGTFCCCLAMSASTHQWSYAVVLFSQVTVGLENLEL